MSDEPRTIYVVLLLRPWAGFEPAPGTFAPFPVSIVPEGVGFLVAYATREEAQEVAGDKGKIMEFVTSGKIKE